MTIDELLAATGLTANDLVPIYDAEAAQNVEPTQKITAAQLAAAVKVLASLVNTTEMNDAIQQSTAKLWENVTSKIALTSSEGTFSQYNAIKSAGSVYIAFVFTATVAKSAGQNYTIKANFSDSVLRPFMRSCNGGSNYGVNNIQIAPDTTTTANIYAYMSGNVNVGAAFWITVTYPCAGA